MADELIGSRAIADPQANLELNAKADPERSPNFLNDAEWLTHLLSLMGYTTSVSDRLEEQDNSQNPVDHPVSSQNHWLEISGEALQESQIQNLIGKDGVVIDAIQYLANVSLNRYRELANATASNDDPEQLPNQSSTQSTNQNFYTVELAGYRTKHLANLQAIANEAVQQVRTTQAEFVIKQLSAADRRYIHQLLESETDIQTYSQGKEPNRHLVVSVKAN